MKKQLSFEEAMERLQAIVERLESGEGSLEESMKLFEEGNRLSVECYDALSKAEQKILQFSQLKPDPEDVQDE